MISKIFVTDFCIAAVYSSSLEKSAVEFAAAYINQQSMLDLSQCLTTLNISKVSTDEIARRNGKSVDCSIAYVRAVITVCYFPL